MAAASERLVVQLTAKDKKELRRRARALGISVSEYVRNATTGKEDEDLAELLDRTKLAAQEAMSMIDDAVNYVNASNVRISAMEEAAAKSRI